MVDEAAMAEVGRRLVEASPGARIVLFGSHARGKAGPRSDLDILVIAPAVEDEAGESVRLMRVLRDLRVPAEVIVVSEDYPAQWRDVRGGLVHAALSEGRVLAG